MFRTSWVHPQEDSVVCFTSIGVSSLLGNNRISFFVDCIV